MHSTGFRQLLALTSEASLPVRVLRVAITASASLRRSATTTLPATPAASSAW